MISLKMFKNIIIVGAGISGNGFANFLISKGINVHIFDDAQNKPRPNLKDFEAIYFSPGVNTKHFLWQEALSSNTTIINDLDEFFIWKSTAKIVAVTGTSGKTTTCCMISHILKSNNINHHLCGNMGVDIFVDSDLYIIEISSFVLARTQKFACDIGVITNMSADHLDVHLNIYNYYNAKLNILRPYLPKNQKFFIGPGLKNCKIKNTLKIPNNLVIPENIIGKHNQQNALVAIGVALDLGLTVTEAIDALKSFNLNKYSFAQYRQTEYKINDNLKIINDSKCTNILSLRAALSNYQDITLILGGLLKIKTLDIKMIKNLLSRVKIVYLFGKDANVFEKLLSKYIKCLKFNLLEEVVEHLSKQQQKGTILFSPCAASFDFYKSYQHRGKHFETLINQTILNGSFA